MLAKKINKGIVATLAVFSVLLLCGFVPYTSDANSWTTKTPMPTARRGAGRGRAVR